jgi:hypothetical protein
MLEVRMQVPRRTREAWRSLRGVGMKAMGTKVASIVVVSSARTRIE